MKPKLILAGMLCMVASLSLFQRCSSDSQENEPAVMSEEELTARGKYLVDIMACSHCHTPQVMTERGPVEDSTHYLAGYVGEPMNLGDFNMMSAPEGTMVMLFSSNFVGHASMFGTVYAANITPDPTGIGNFSLEDFKRAFQQGKYRGEENGRPLQPPMPWQAYAHMDSTDVKAIYTYLMKGVRPVSNTPPPPVMAAMPPGGPPAEHQ